jgi:hypothetical protein
MLKQFGQISRREHLWDKNSVMRWSILWAALSIGIYLLFGTSMQGTGRPEWYRTITAYPIQNIPVLASSLLCLRNGISRRMPSGSKVWLMIGIALMCYFLGNMFFSSWELVWHLNSTGSLGDPFFVLFYVLLSGAMLQAVTSKRIRLNMYQWIIVGIAGIYAASLATLILAPAANAAPAAPTPLVMQVSSNSNSEETVAPLLLAQNDANEKAEPATPEVAVPGWVATFDQLLKPYGKTLNIFYVWCDVALFCLAAVMVLGCWGGKLSTAWRVNAQAIGCIYIADMWFAYAGNQIADYQSGFTLEVFWALGCLQFGIAAAMEFDQVLMRQRQANLM